VTATLVNLLALAIVLLACILCALLVCAFYLRRICGRLNRLPRRETGRSSDGTWTYYAEDVP
jgi:hypothetical protein